MRRKAVFEIRLYLVRFLKNIVVTAYFTCFFSNTNACDVIYIFVKMTVVGQSFC